MANKHSSLPSNYMIQVKTASGNTESGTQALYSDIKLMDAEEKYFITEDEIVRCLCETLCKQLITPSTAPSDELSAEKLMIASPTEVIEIAQTILK